MGDEIPRADAPRSDAPRSDGKTVIRNSCGHEFAYKINRPQAVEWLKGRPCPSCMGRKGGRPKGRKQELPKLPEQQQQPQEQAPRPIPDRKDEPQQAPADPRLPKPDEAWVAAALENLPDGAFHRVLPDVVLAVSANVPVWLQGPPGTTKSTVAQQAAETLGLRFYPVSCHEMMTESKLFGFTDANGTDHRTALWDAFEYGGLLLLDEVDNGNPNLLAALNSLLSNGHCTFGSGTHVNRHADFRVVATANTAGLGPEQGYVGRNGVDLATRDRFATIEVLIDNALENALAYLYAGEREAFDAALPGLRAAARTTLERRSSLSQAPPGSEAILKAVRAARSEVEQRFRGTVVSPRATMHCAALTAQGFSLREALGMKLPGIDRAGVESILGGLR